MNIKFINLLCKTEIDMPKKSRNKKNILLSKIYNISFLHGMGSVLNINGDNDIYEDDSLISINDRMSSYWKSIGNDFQKVMSNL